MADLADVVEQLDRLHALLAIGFSQQIDHVREQLAASPVNAAIMAAVGDDWVASGDLQRAVSKGAKVSERTVRTALAELAERHLLLVRGSGRQTSYKSSGLL